MSALMPFARPLKVGGNSERRAKFTSRPAGADAEHATVTVKRFAVDGGVFVGTSTALTCVQPPVAFARRGVECEARRVPSAACSASVRIGGTSSERAGGRR